MRIKTSTFVSRLFDDSGQTAMFLSLGIIFFMGMIAVVGDTSLVWMQKRNLQNAADAAALAGAQKLPDDPNQARTDAQAYATNNVSGLTLNLATVQSGNLAIEARVEKPAQSIFSSIGLGSPTIRARAVATIRSAQLPGPGVVPLTIDRATWLANQNANSVTLKEYAQNNGSPTSSFQLTDLPPNAGGAQELCNYLVGGSTENILDPVESKTGNNGNLQNCLITRMDAATSNSCLTYGQVTDSNGFLLERCNPYIGARRNSNGVQPTAVIVIPIVESFCQGGCAMDIIGSGSQLRQFAFFLIDRTTVETVNGVGPTCSPGNGGGGGGGGGNPPPGQCWITGRFLKNQELGLAASGVPVTGYDPNAIQKVVQLTE